MPRKPPPRGRPFQKGQSGNPGGRPKGEREIRELIQRRGPDLVDKLFEVAETSEDPHAVISAVKELLNRGYGKPAESIKLSGDVSLTQKRIVLEDRGAPDGDDEPAA